MTLTFSPKVTLYPVQGDKRGGEGAHVRVTTTTNDVHIYQNKTVVDDKDLENTLMESEMFIQLDNENDFLEVTCLDPGLLHRSIKVSVLGMFNIYKKLRIIQFYTRFFVLIISIRFSSYSWVEECVWVYFVRQELLYIQLQKGS